MRGITNLIIRTMKKAPKSAFALVFIFVIMASAVFGQGNAMNAETLSQSEIDRIINTFTAKEAQFRQALVNYSFKRDALLQSLGMGGQVTGEYHRVSLFTFDDQGVRFEKITAFPMPSFAGVTQEDLDDLGGISPFALEPSQIGKYDFKYVGKEKIDELDLYVFDVSPKVMPNPKKTKQRFFLGRVWVDQEELQIVKTRGKGVPETKINKFPYVETYREQIDGRYWFPTYSYADEELLFEDGNTLHVRMRVKYTDFSIAKAKVKIIEIEDPDAPKKETQPPATTPKKP
jgi:muconolactone delta-isomerase